MKKTFLFVHDRGPPWAAAAAEAATQPLEATAGPLHACAGLGTHIQPPPLPQPPAPQEAPDLRGSLCETHQKQIPKDLACGPCQPRALPIARMLLTKDGLALNSKAIIFI